MRCQDNVPSTIRITHVAEAPAGWQKQWGANNRTTIVYRNAQCHKIVSNVDEAKEYNRNQTMTAALNAHSPWVKHWDDQQSKVVYHHPQRKETVLTVASARYSDQIVAPHAHPPWVKKWHIRKHKVVYHHPQRNEIALTVADAQSSDQETMKTLQRKMHAESIARFVSPVKEATLVLANFESTDDGGLIVDFHPNSNISDAVVLLQQFVDDVVPKCVIPECVLQSDENMSLIDKMWLELKTRQQDIKDVVNSGSIVDGGSIVDDELVVSRNNARAALVKHAKPFVLTFNKNSVLISSIETNLTSFLQSLRAWITISDDEHASEMVASATDCDRDCDCDNHNDNHNDSDSNSDNNNDNDSDNDTDTDTDCVIGVVEAALTSVDEHQADAIKQRQQVAQEIGRLTSVFYSTCTRVGAETSIELFSSLPPALVELSDAIEAQRSLTLQLQNTFPETEIRTATATLCHYLEELLLTIEHLRDHVVHCKGIVVTHKPYLNRAPDVARLKKLGKAIRAAERKYNTAKMDEKDAIEEDEEDGTTTAAEATRARLKALKALQSARHQKDTLMTQLVRQKEEHFPELDLADAVGKSLKEMFSSLRNLDIVSTGFLLTRDCISHKVLSTEGNHTVYEAEFPDGTRRALKAFPLKDTKSMDTFRREAALLHRPAHPHIVKLLGVHLDENGTCAYIEMPLYNGGTLTTWLAAEERSPELLRAIVHQLLQAVHHLHAHHVVHSDIHPSNIFITNDVETGAWMLVLGDFDVSINLAERTMYFLAATKRYVAGHDGYIAPELRPPRNEKARTAVDMYAVGVLLQSMSDKIDSSNFTQLVATMLSDSPQLRPTAHAAMQNPYFLDEQAQVQARLNEVAATLNT